MAFDCDYEKSLKVALVGSFNKNFADCKKKDFGVSTKTVFPEYYSGKTEDGHDFMDLDAIRGFSEMVRRGIADGKWSSKLDSKLEIYKVVRVTREQVAGIAQELGFTTKDVYIEQMRGVLREYVGRVEAPRVSDWCKTQLENPGAAAAAAMFPYSPDHVSSSVQKLKKLLRGCVILETATEDMLQRNFSARCNFAGSKDFEKNFRSKMAQVLEPDMYKDVPAQKILRAYHLFENPAQVSFRGFGVISFRGGLTLDCSVSRDAISLERGWFENVDRVDARHVLTVENLTTFHDLKVPEGTLLVYTGGYANSLVVEFIKQCAWADGCSLAHFGDLDAYGFLILQDLERKVGRHINSYRMDLETYLKNRKNGITMTEGNRKHLLRFLDGDKRDAVGDAERELFRVMLEDGLTLEQEGIIEI